MLEKLLQIFHKVQQTAACHQKYINIINTLYKQSCCDEFVNNLILIIVKLFEQKLDVGNSFIKRTLEFFAKACAQIAIEENRNNTNNNETSMFLSTIIPKILQYSDLSHIGSRYYSTQFTDLLLSNINLHLQLEESLYEEIHNKIVLRLEDNKVAIRLQAISVLSYLQCPTDPACTVIPTFLNYLNDSNKNIRHAILKVIGINKLTLPKIIERIDDINATVRSVVYWKFAEISPRFIKIIDRIRILKRGFNDNNEQVKNMFHNMLDKWLSQYDGSYLKFLQSLYLSSSEDDLDALKQISKSIIEFFLESDSIENLIAILPIENRLICDFTIENLLYWKCMVNYFQASQHFEDYLTQIVPELSQFCSYIESVISKKSLETMDEYVYTEYQFKLLTLFEIADGYDLSDEVIAEVSDLIEFRTSISEISHFFLIQVGRTTLRRLIKDILIKYRFTDKVLSKMIIISYKTCTNVDRFIAEMYGIINELRELFLEQSNESEIKLEDINQNCDAICYCLDVLIKVLEIPAVKKLNSQLKDLKDDFLLPLIITKNVNVHWRVLKCLSLFCYIDRDTTECAYQLILCPILNYKYSNYAECKALEICIQGLMDLFRIYGKELINMGSINLDCDDLEIYSPEIWFPEILVRILDEECNSLKLIAVKVLCHTTLVFPLKSTILTEIIIKWFTLNTQERSTALRDLKTIKPVISKIIRAPSDNCLSKINLDDVIRYYAFVISTDDRENIEISIKDLLMQIAKTFTTLIQQCLTKILLDIDLPIENFDQDKELERRIPAILPNIYDQLTSRNLKKFLNKLENLHKSANDRKQPSNQPVKRKKLRKNPEDTTSSDCSDYKIECNTSSERNSDRFTTIVDATSESDIEDRVKLSKLEIC